MPVQHAKGSWIGREGQLLSGGKQVVLTKKIIHVISIEEDWVGNTMKIFISDHSI